MNVVLVIAAVIIVGVAIYITVGSKKRKWYKVTLANNDVMLLYRDLNERWWKTNDRYMRFVNEYGKEVTFPSAAHWILMWEEIPSTELNRVREEIRQINIQNQKGD